MSVLRDHLATLVAPSNRSKVRIARYICVCILPYAQTFFLLLNVFHVFIQVHTFCSNVLTAILNELLQRENRVLHFWTMKKRRLDQCQQYIVFERSAKQVKTINYKYNNTINTF